MSPTNQPGRFADRLHRVLYLRGSYSSWFQQRRHTDHGDFQLHGAIISCNDTRPFCPSNAAPTLRAAVEQYFVWISVPLTSLSAPFLALLSPRIRAFFRRTLSTIWFPVQRQTHVPASEANIFSFVLRFRQSARIRPFAIASEIKLLWVCS